MLEKTAASIYFSNTTISRNIRNKLRTLHNVAKMPSLMYINELIKKEKYTWKINDLKKQREDIIAEYIKDNK